MPADPRDPFRNLRPTRPRLMATAEAVDRIKQALARDEAAGSKVGRELKAHIIKKANEAAPPQTGHSLKKARNVRKRFQTLGLAWLLDRDRRYVARAKEELAAVCAFRDWNPSHFLDTAEVTHAVAIGYDWFYDELSAAERNRIATAIVDKGLRPGFVALTTGPKRTWPNQATNWNIVCNAGLMIGALAVLGDNEPEADEFVRKVFLRCLDSVPTGFSGYSPDGSWDEGPGYWQYATEYAAYLLSALDTALGHEFGLGNLPGLNKTGFFRMHTEGSAAGAADEEMAGKLFNFSDCEEARSGSWCMRWLYDRYKEPLYNWVALQDGQKAPMDLFWFSPDRPPAKETIPGNVVFRGSANVAMLRGDARKGTGGFRPWEREEHGDVYVGIRAGENSRDGVHAHLDLGSFVLDASQVRWAVDIPPFENEEGTTHKSDYGLPGYFDVELERRFRYYRTGTIGHNALVINGFNQPLGVYTEVVGFGQSPGQIPDLAVVVLDLTAAYPDCLRVRRGFALISQQHVLIVDEFTPKQDITVLWQMHTRAKAKIDGRTVVLKQEHDGASKQFFVGLVEPAAVGWEIQEARVTQPKEGPNDGVCKLVASMHDVSGPARIGVFLSATAHLNAPWPGFLNEPLWRWIEWTEKEAPAEMGKAKY